MSFGAHGAIIPVHDMNRAAEGRAFVPFLLDVLVLVGDAVTHLVMALMRLVQWAFSVRGCSDAQQTGESESKVEALDRHGCGLLCRGVG
ncbi:MAG: hypothetical protein P4L90_00510 [Rhodopila sp.]|nr:hypothetical protein [Rhodopila sp.]